MDFELMNKTLVEEWEGLKDSFKDKHYVAVVEFAEHIKGICHTLGEANNILTSEVLDKFEFIDRAELIRMQKEAREEIKKALEVYKK